MPEPVAGNPQSLVNARNQFFSLGLQTTVGPSEALIRQQFSSAPTCTGSVGALLFELLDLGYDIANAQAIAQRAAYTGARPEEVIENLIRACDGKAEGMRCSPLTVAGAPMESDGLCSTPMASIGACTFGDAGCGSRRVCLPGMKIPLSQTCAIEPTNPVCVTLDRLTSAGVSDDVAEVLADASPSVAQGVLDALARISSSRTHAIAARLGLSLG